MPPRKRTAAEKAARQAEREKQLSPFVNMARRVRGIINTGVRNGTNAAGKQVRHTASRGDVVFLDMPLNNADPKNGGKTHTPHPAVVIKKDSKNGLVLVAMTTSKNRGNTFGKTVPLAQGNSDFQGGKGNFNSPSFMKLKDWKWVSVAEIIPSSTSNFGRLTKEKRLEIGFNIDSELDGQNSLKEAAAEHAKIMQMGYLNYLKQERPDMVKNYIRMMGAYKRTQKQKIIASASRRANNGKGS